MSSIVIGNNQNKWKDSYAPAPVINLTVRANGEERVQVMDSLGQFIQAGITPPSVAPAPAIGAVGGLTALKWIGYAYVYAATQRYPLIENDNAPSGKQGPRSNPSPSATYQVDVAGHKVNVTVTKSDRVDITEIWIYRTDYYDTQDEALDAIDGGFAYYAGSIINDGSPGTTVFEDFEVIITGNNTIEIDNFEAPQFQQAVYDDPYFYGFGNFAFEDAVSVTANGIVTLTDADSKWFDGRNAQIVTLQGITSGGSDGYGSYYFKWLTNTTAQLCLDIALTQNGPVNSTGDTFIRIKGPSNFLYRSKPRNPFSWGVTDVVDDINIPHPYAFAVGGGQGTSIAVVPILNLLKVDTEGPNKTYVFNLNGKGTSAFESSKREISGDFSTSNLWTQFAIKGNDGNSYLWFFDAKHAAICQTDGASNVDISSPVFDSLRSLSTDANSRLLAHGAYVPFLQLACMWFTSDRNSDDALSNDTMVAFHYPTNTWTTIPQLEVLCSTSFLNRPTNQQIVLVGTESGQIGWAFHPDTFCDWVDATNPLVFGDRNPFPTKVTFQGFGDPTHLYQATSNYALSDLIGIWSHIMQIRVEGEKPVYKGQARISLVEGTGIYGAGTSIFTFDKFIDADGAIGTNLDSCNRLEQDAFEIVLYPGAILCNCCKFFNLNPFEGKKLDQLWLTADNVQLNRVENGQGVPSWGLSLIGQTMVEDYGETSTQITKFYLTQDKRTDPDSGGTLTSNTFKTDTPTTIDQLRSFQVSYTDLGYKQFTLFNHSIILK